ncbi:hypothetical protein T484DRAFT_1788414, partial [Baffinella frigidus]
MAGREGEAPQAASGGSGQQPRPASLAEGAVGLESGVTQAGGGIGPATLPASGQWLGGGVGYQTGAARSSGGAEFSPDRLVGGSSEVGQKEKELHDMNEYRIHALECSVAERDRQVAELRVSLRGMKADFEFNLKLIEDRDAELERYDGACSTLNGALRERLLVLCTLERYDGAFSTLNGALREREAELSDLH